MSKKCVAFSKSKLGLETPDNRKSFYAGWDAALAEQAEQEPDYFGLTHDHTWLSIDKKQYDKLKPKGRMACYAAPVRTKDLTDVDLWNLWEKSDSNIAFARAVIAADREKTK